MKHKLEINPARTIDELPEGARIGVIENFDEDDDRVRTFTVYYADEIGHPLPSSRDSIDDEEPERYFSGVVRTFYRAPCDAYEVIYSIVAPGWGPLLYDIAIELASEYGNGLMSDRKSVSDDACRVWAIYRRRGDVQTRPLPERRACHPGAECSTEVAFTKAPETLRRLTSEKKILYFDDRPPGAAGIVPLPDPEDWAEVAAEAAEAAAEPVMAKPIPLSMVANPNLLQRDSARYFGSDFVVREMRSGKWGAALATHYVTGLGGSGKVDENWVFGSTAAAALQKLEAREGRTLQPWTYMDADSVNEED